MFMLLWVAIAWGLPLSETPTLGVKTQVEIGRDTANGGGWYWLEFDYPIEQGDRFQIEVEPVRGAVVRLRAEVWREHGQGFTPFEGTPQEAGKIHWTMSKPLPGSTARIRVISDSTGKFQVKFSKVGAPPVQDPRDKLITRLQAEIEQLRKQIAAQKKEIEELRKQLANKK